MKLSKSVLAGSLATAGIVLGAIAPAVTAQAATSSGSIDANGNLQHEDPAINVGKLGDKDSKLAIAYDATDTDKNRVTGEATAQSNANVTVQTGLLTLDAVPDFGFANAAEGTEVALDNNNYDNEGADSQAKGKLTVTESRENQPGFVLSAAITAFGVNKTDEATGKTSVDPASAKSYILHLTPAELKNDTGENVGTGLKTNEVNISGTDVATAGTSADVMDLASGTYASGPINASFTADDNDAFLNLKTADANKNSGAKSYNATITWTLNAAAKATA
ncbi:WxL domain-containing protein [Companilactobacillus sp. HBUAS59544]|uniref:WxL domain-containing protein n=1 Tax=Companilactobacillus sp. HBUAS59544 TaxID=3109363 RepID=UPI002FF1BE6E